MKRWIVLVVGVLILVPCLSQAATLKLVIPSGFNEAFLLSPGTSAVLDHMRGRLTGSLEALSAQYNIAGLKQELEKAQALSANRREVYRQGGKAIREQYISKLNITITSVTANISSESSMGEIIFTYTATNNSDRIISDVIYTPRIGDKKIPVASKLVLEFIDAKTLKSGLAPGHSISDNSENPERFSFFVGEISKQDMQYIKANLNKAFALEIQDLHFMNAVGYKDQAQILDAEHAFQVRLRELEQGGETAQRDAKAKADAYASAVSAYNLGKEESVGQFKVEATELKNSSRRASSAVDKKNRCVFKDIEPGSYYIYASNGQGNAVFQPVEVGQGRVKKQIDTVVRDPFVP
ncbi:MAG: hypothetical protein ABFD81_14310 [Syntrophaceae bacterium]